MVDQQLLNFIKEHKEHLQNENSKREMKNALLAQGWPSNVVDEAMLQVAPPMNVPQYHVPIPPVASQPMVGQPTVGQSMTFPAVSFSAPQISPTTPIFTPQISSAAALPGPFALLGEALMIFSRRPLTFLGISFISSLIAAIYPTFNMLWAATHPAGSIVSSADTLILIIGLVLAVLVIVIGGTLSTLALIYAIKDSAEDIGIIESYRRGIRKIFSFWWIGLLTTSIVLGGSLLLIIPGIIFAVWFGLAMFVLVAEDVKGLNALLKSKAYVNGYWWPVAGRSAVMMLFAMIPIGLLLILNPILGGYWGRMVYSFSVQLVLTPVILAYTFLIYSHLRAIKGEFAVVASGKQRFGLILLGIIGVLAITVPALILTSLESAQTKIHDARRVVDIMQLRLALDMYYNGNSGKYPMVLSDLAPMYIPTIPSDPLDRILSKTSYFYTSDGSSYHLGASLEDSANLALKSDADKTDSVINGADSAGCAGEPNRYCYDIVSEPPQTNLGISASNYVAPVAQPMRSSMEDVFITDSLDGNGAEEYYKAAGNTYIGLCSSTLASSMWFSSALADVKGYNGGVAPTCNSSATAYAVSSPLFDRTKFHCVDSTGFRGEITIPLGVRTVCPR